MTRLRAADRPYWITALLLILAVVLSVAVGSVFISPATFLTILGERIQGLEIPSTLKKFDTILFGLRLPRTLLVAIAGAGLAGSGAAYQGLFRNPLADPYLMGVAAGGGLGAVLAMSTQYGQAWLGLLTVPVASFLGALLTVWIVYRLAKIGRSVPSTNLILAGVAVGSFATSLTWFLMITTTNDELRRALNWFVGGGSMGGWQPVFAVIPFITLGILLLFTTGHALNVFQFGEEQAQQLGLPVERIQILVIVAASLSTAAAVSFLGIIGFIGLIVPHVVRTLWGADYKRILPLSVIAGAALLLYADVLARVVLAPQEIPVGIITALGGAPFFLWILRRAQRQMHW
jgi:iron complex transport system permease protein